MTPSSGGQYCTGPVRPSRHRSDDPPRRPIDVLFTHPYFWPHVRRGAEREIHDLGTRLTERGHRVRLVTSQPTGVASSARVGGIDVRYVRVPGGPRLQRRGWHHELRFGAVAAAVAGASRADLLHAWLYADAAFLGRFAAIQRGRPLVLKLTGTVVPERIIRTPVDDRLFRGALARADEVWCNSRFAVSEMAGFDVPMQVVPAGLDTTVFAPGGDRAEQPTVLATSAPDEPRKRVVDLVDAWPDVLAAVPDARLVLAGRASPATREQLLDRLPSGARRSVTFAGLVDDDTLVRLYRSAWVAVTPSVFEALGLTTIEALACGTPVVGADSGATPELIPDGAVGSLYAPADPAACAAALVPWLTEPPSAERAAYCVAAAAPHAWGPIVDLVLARYWALLEGNR